YMNTQFFKGIIMTSLILCIIHLSYAQTMSFDWVFKIGGKNVESGNAIATDLSGNIFVSGYFRDSAEFNPGTESNILVAHANTYTNDVFIAKYSPEGNYLWAKNIGGNSNDVGNGIA